MSQRKPPPIDALDFRADSYSPDGGTIIVSLTTKHSPEQHTYSLPVTALYGFIADLQKLQSGGPVPSSPPAEQPATPPVSKAPLAAKDRTRINITVPKRWMMRSGLPEHPLVYLIFDPQTERQAGYALPAPSAREMATSLVKHADLLEQHKEKSN